MLDMFSYKSLMRASTAPYHKFRLVIAFYFFETLCDGFKELLALYGSKEPYRDQKKLIRFLHALHRSPLGGNEDCYWPRLLRRPPCKALKDFCFSALMLHRLPPTSRCQHASPHWQPDALTNLALPHIFFQDPFVVPFQDLLGRRLWVVSRATHGFSEAS